MTKTALIIVDMQNDYFPDGKWTLNGVEAAAENVAKVLADFRERQQPVIHVRHEFSSLTFAPAWHRQTVSFRF
jgi:nicotinamidase-related amidase